MKNSLMLTLILCSSLHFSCNKSDHMKTFKALDTQDLNTTHTENTDMALAQHMITMDAQEDISLSHEDNLDEVLENLLDGKDFMISTHQSQKTYHDFIWKAVDGVQEYTIVYKQSSPAYSVKWNPSQKKYSTQKGSRSFYKLRNKLHNSSNIIVIKADPDKRYYRVKVRLFPDNATKSSLQARNHFWKYDYKIVQYDSASDTIIDLDDTYQLQDIFVLPESPRYALLDVDKSLFHSVVEFGGFCNTSLCNPDKTLQTIKDETWDQSGNGSSGFYHVKKDANSLDVTFTWENYDIYGQKTPIINGTLTGTIGEWQHYIKKSNGDYLFEIAAEKGSSKKVLTKLNPDIMTLKDQGKLIILNGSLHASGLYQATLNFQDIVIGDGQDQPHGVVEYRVSLMDKDRSKRKLSISYTPGDNPKNTITEVLNNNGRSDITQIFVIPSLRTEMIQNIYSNTR